MSVLTKKLVLCTTTMRRYQHDKIFPDDKWVTLQAMQYVHGWWTRQMARLDEHSKSLQPPQVEVKTNPTLQDKIMVELKPDMLKYRLLYAMCYVRNQFKGVSSEGIPQSFQKAHQTHNQEIDPKVEFQLPKENEITPTDINSASNREEVVPIKNNPPRTATQKI